MNNKVKKLCLIQELCRHGARRPLVDTSIDSPKDWNYPFDLTQTGMNQHFLIGKELQKRLIVDSDFLSYDSLVNNEIKVINSGAARAIQSANCQLFGLFPKVAKNLNSNWYYDPNIDSPPLKMNIDSYSEIVNFSSITLPNNFEQYVSINDELLRGTLVYHDKIMPLRLSQLETDYTKQFLEMLKEIGFMSFFDEKFKEDCNLIRMGDYMDTLICYNYEKKELPFKLSDEEYLKCLFVYDFKQTYVEFGNLEISRIVLADLVKCILNEIDNYINAASNTKFILYSAHDDNLRGFLLPLGFLKWTQDFEFWKANRFSASSPYRNPMISSVLMFELYCLNNESGHSANVDDYIVNLVYNDTILYFEEFATTDVPYNLFKLKLLEIFIN